MRERIERFCLRDDLRTPDPYDIWQTNFGYRIKDLFNRNRTLGLPPAAALTLFDTFLNNRHRIFYAPREYPIVRALAALTLLNRHEGAPDAGYLPHVRSHLLWLAEHPCQGYHGHCWGLGFRYAVRKDIVHDANTPFATMTPYPLEAFVRYRAVTGSGEFDAVIAGIMEFFDRDIQVIEETDSWMATSYGPWKDRIVVNAASYAMYAFALGLSERGHESPPRWREKVFKLYRFVQLQQRPDGSWLYSPKGKSFIDCFHSCIVLKNLIKTDRILSLPGCSAYLEKGYEYLKSAFLDPDAHLYRRFSLSNKPSIVKFDLYDNAEMLLVAALLDDRDEIERLSRSIERHFLYGEDVYSQIDILGLRRNKNMLRWAVMPYLHALSLIGSATGDS